ncbi:MAG: hypothetical protein IJI14_13280 [Anaerolineaceae bacterium]|nr:hypothetical protein [Anaerolineaceae bacterium]
MKDSTRVTLNVRSGGCRAGMHQKAEHAFRRSQMTDSGSKFDLPPEIAAAMPPLEDKDNVVIASIAEEEAEISVENVSEKADETESENILISSEPSEDGSDWNPVTGGIDCESCLIGYISDEDGGVRAIPDPLGVLGG